MENRLVAGKTSCSERTSSAQVIVCEKSGVTVLREHSPNKPDLRREQGQPGYVGKCGLRNKEIATAVRRLIREKLEVKDFTDDTLFLAMGLD